MKNIVYALVLALLWASCQSGESNSEKEELYESTCEDFRIGVFEMYVDTHKIVIQRNENRQLEKTSIGLSNYEVHWTGECQFELTLIETTFPAFKEKLGSTYVVDIVSTNGDEYTCSLYEFGYSEKEFSTLKKIR